MYVEFGMPDGTPPNMPSTERLNASRRVRWQDMTEWEKLATQAHMRLPRFETALTTGGMEAWLRRLGIRVRGYLAWDGSRTLQEFIDRNPDWSYREWSGLVLEHRDLMATLPSDGVAPIREDSISDDLAPVVEFICDPETELASAHIASSCDETAATPPPGGA